MMAASTEEPRKRKSEILDVEHRKDQDGRHSDALDDFDDNSEESGNAIFASACHHRSQKFSSIQAPVFVDADAMKMKVREAIMKQKYDVTDFYLSTGLWQRIARHPRFEQLTLVVISFNAVWIWIDTDHNDADMLLQADPLFQLMEHLFCMYFSFEWYTRYRSFKRKRSALNDAWFVFDSCLVLTMVLETWVMSSIVVFIGGAGSGGMGNASLLKMARLFRLSRMARMARLLRAMPELMILVKGMVASMRSVFFTLCLLFILMYIFGIAFRQLGRGTSSGEKYFRTVPAAMYSLLIHGTLLDNVEPTAHALGLDGPHIVALFFVFVLLAALTVLNMLIGVLCEVVSAVAASEKEEMTVTFVKSKMEDIMASIDEDGSGEISKEEFSKILENPDAARALNDVGVDVVGLVDLSDIIFECDDNPEANPDGKQLSFSDFMDVVLQLRGSNNATVKDIVDLRKFVRTSALETQRRVNNLDDKVTALRTDSRLYQSGGRKQTASKGTPRSSGVSGRPSAPTDPPGILNLSGDEGSGLERRSWIPSPPDSPEGLPLAQKTYGMPCGFAVTPDSLVSPLPPQIRPNTIHELDVPAPPATPMPQFVERGSCPRSETLAPLVEDRACAGPSEDLSAWAAELAVLVSGKRDDIQRFLERIPATRRGVHDSQPILSPAVPSVIQREVEHSSLATALSWSIRLPPSVQTSRSESEGVYGSTSRLRDSLTLALPALQRIQEGLDDPGSSTSSSARVDLEEVGEALAHVLTELQHLRQRTL